jgi:prevent-host-death family protein
MLSVNIHEAKTKLSALLARVEKGEEIVIARNGRPIARLIRADASPMRRVPGLDRDRIWYAPDMHEPLPAEAAVLFER